MKKNYIKILLLGVSLSLTGFSAFSQKVGADSSGSKRELIKSDYNRLATTVLFADMTNNSGRFDYMMKSTNPNNFTLPKYDDNSLKSNILKSNLNLYNLRNDLDENKPYKMDSLISVELYNSKIANKVLEKVFNVSNDGVFSAEILQQRGMYNASHDNAMIAASKKIGVEELKNSGYSLLSNLYIIVIGSRNIRTYEEIYDEADAKAMKLAASTKTEFKPVKRVQEGYQGSAIAYLYHIRMNDSISMNIFDSYWNEDKNNQNVNSRYESFKNANFSIEYVGEYYHEAEGSQFIETLPGKTKKSDSELISELAINLFSSAIDEIEAEEEVFQVKAKIVRIRPISADIGSKEGLNKADRYFAYETRETKEGELYSKRIGAVRVKHIANNSFSAMDSIGMITDKSTFYQYAGGGIKPNMTLRQKPDIGLGLCVGASVGPNGIRGNVNLNALLSKFCRPKELYFKLNFSLSSLDNETNNNVGETLEISGLFQNSTINLEDGDYKGDEFTANLIKTDKNWMVMIVDGGLEKRITFARRFYLGLEAGAGYAFVSISGDEYTDDYSVGSIGFHATPTFGFYLSPKISLSAFAKTQSFGSFTSGKITRDKDDKKTLYPLQDKEEDIKFSFDKATGSKISEKISGLSFGAALNFSF